MKTIKILKCNFDENEEMHCDENKKNRTKDE